MTTTSRRPTALDPTVAPRRRRGAGLFAVLLALVLALAVLALAAVQVAGAAPPTAPEPADPAGPTTGPTTVPTTPTPPTADDRAAADLRHTIEENGWRIAALGERYNEVRLRYDEARARSVEIQVRSDRTRTRLARAEAELRRAAASLYRAAGTTAPRPIGGAGTGTRTRVARYGEIAARREAARLGKLRRLREELAADAAEAAGAIRDAQAARGLLRTTRDRITEANTLQLRLLAEIDGRRLTADGVPGAIDPALVGADIPQVPVSPRVAAVILYARAQLGRPYVFATAGPATFDCSGLTMMAWRQAGVPMAHFSGAQYDAFPKVPLSQLQPGDLVFRGPGGRQHVALYIGNGLQIAATHTGDYVRVQPLMSKISGAVRPG